MDVQHLNVKFFARDPGAVDLGHFIPIFHSWIQKQDMEDLLIDVADYRHVFAGPGVLLIGHQANYSMDNAANRPGLLYNQKAPLNGDASERLRRVTRAALLACRRLEEEPRLEGALEFGGEEFELIINDRLLAPNTERTFQACRKDVEGFLKMLYGGAAYRLDRNPDPRERFNVRISASTRFDASTLLRNLENQFHHKDTK